MLARRSIFHGEYLVRIHADTFGGGTLSDIHLPAGLSGCQEFILWPELPLRMVSAGDFQAGNDLGNHEGVLEVKLARMRLDALGLVACGLVQKISPLCGEAIDEAVRAALVVIFDLRTRSFKITVVIQELEPPQNLLATTFREVNNLVGTEKTLPVDMPEDVMVADGEAERTDGLGAAEAGEPVETHLSILQQKRSLIFR